MHFLQKEKFKQVKLDKSLRYNYAISNFGRLISYTKKYKDGNLVKGSTIGGYKLMRYKTYRGEKIFYKSEFFHRLVAEHFLKRQGKKYVFVLHLNHAKANNEVSNLKWATKEEMITHNQSSPRVLSARKKIITQQVAPANAKLTAAKVREIKKQALNPKRRMTLRELAQKSGISEMQLHRIKSGENWGYIKIS